MATEDQKVQKSGGFSGLKGFVNKYIVDVGEAAPAQEAPKSQAVNPTPPTAGASPATTYVAAPTVNPEMLHLLNKKVLDRKTPYTALLDASTKLEKVIPDADTRVKAAFTMISADGARSISSITQAIDLHVSDLEGERLRFKQSTEAQVTAKVASARAKAAQLTSSADSDRQQIEKLQQQITALQERIASSTAEAQQISNQADADEQSIRSIEQQFNDAVDFAKSELSSRKASLAAVLS
jgi:hypothetical protein